MIHDILQFLFDEAGFINNVLVVIAPYVVTIMLAQMLSDDILVIMGVKSELGGMLGGDKHEQDR